MKRGRATTSGPRSVFARRPSTGEAVWAYQITPHDAHDFDGANENIIVDLPIGGVSRRVAVRFDRNGFVYTHDARTGPGSVGAEIF